MKKLIYILFSIILLSSFVTAIDFNDGAVSYFAFEADMSDSWGNASDCTVTGDPSLGTANCKIGNCYTYDGTGDYGLCGGDIGDLMGAGADATINMWIAPSVVAGDDGYFSISNLGSAFGTLDGNIESSTYRIIYGTGTGGISTAAKITTIPIMITWRKNASITSLWVNGTEMANVADINAYNWQNYNTNIGVYYSTSTSMAGGIDELGIWKRALETEEIVALFYEGGGCNPVTSPLGCDYVPPTYKVNITINSPKNYTSTNIMTQDLYFNVSINDTSIADITNASLYINGEYNKSNTTAIINNANSSFLGAYFNLGEGSSSTFKWSIKVIDTLGNETMSSNFSRIIVAAPNIELYSPQNNSNISDSTPNLYYNVSLVPAGGASTYIRETKLYIDGVYSQTNSTPVILNGNNSFLGVTFLEGYHNWSIEAWAVVNGIATLTTGNNLNMSINYSILTDSNPPTIDTNYQNDTHYYKRNLTVSTNFTDSIGINDINYSIDGLTILYESDLDVTSYNANLSYYVANLTSGYHYLTITVNDYVPSNKVSSNYSFFIENITQSYDVEILNNISSEFTLDLNLEGHETPSSVILEWNNTNYTATPTITNNTLSRYSVSFLPYVYFNSTELEKNVSLRWFFNLTNNIENTSYSNQTINEIGLDNCSLFSTLSLNYSIRDEENNSLINSSISATFNYYSSSNSKTYTLSLLNKDGFQICIYPSWINLSGDYEIAYSSESYPQRKYIDNLAYMSNISQNINLYSQYVDDGTYISFRTLTTLSAILPGVTIKVQKIISGVLTTISIEDSDDSGIATFFLNIDDDYLFTFSKSGYETQAFTLRPTSSEITNIIMVSESEEEEKPPSIGISYGFSPTQSVLNNNTNTTFTFNLSSNYRTLSNCNFSLRNTTHVLSFIEGTFDTDYCIASILFDTSNYTLIIAQAEYTLNGTDSNTVSKHYTIRYNYEGRFSLKNFLDDLKSFGASGFNDFTRMMLAMIVITAIIVSLAIKVPGFNDPEILVLIALGLIFIFSYVSFFTITNPNIPTIRDFDLSKWLIFIICAFLSGSYFIKKEFF